MEGTQETHRTRRHGHGLFLLILVGVAGVYALWWFGIAPFGASADYKAVFLTNDQVYFGKLSKPYSRYPVLEDVYYIRVSQPLQSGATPSSPEINLVKLGSELHGPRDTMMINRDHVLFIEDLKADSQVVSAIAEEKQGTAQAVNQ